MRTWGFFASSSATISRIFPALPPMNAWVGAGKPAQASGALPQTTCRFSNENRSRFCPSSAAASSRRSTAQTCPRFACKAISTDTEPVPAPMSQQTLRSVSRSLERHTARTSLFVIGTTGIPSALRRKASSGRPGVTTASGWGFSMSATLKGA